MFSFFSFSGGIRVRTLIASVAILMVSALYALGQATIFSQISGAVKDSTGLPISGAKVQVTQTNTSLTRSAVTTTDGVYTIPNLPVGPYTLRVDKEGFSPFIQTGIVLEVNTNPEINVTLTVGSLQQQIEVQANAAMVETQTTSVGQVIDQHQVVDLPLNGRQPSQLIALSGAAVSANTGFTSIGGIVNSLDYPTVSAYSVAGGQGNATNYFLDGGTHMDMRTNVGLPLPFPDALQEFKVETSTLPANYGTHPGGAVNAVTKSGSNSFHGDLFEFLRNGDMDARNFFAPTPDTLRRNQFGGVLGGPVKKDSLFFFIGFQGTTERTAPVTNVAFVPTAAVLSGNFQTILSPPCQSKPVNLLPSSGAINNILPVSRLNPVALKYVSLLPVSSDPCGRILYGIPSDDNEFQGVARVDWQRTQNDTIFVRYFITDYGLDAYYNKANLLTAANPGLADRVQSAAVGDTYLINPTTVSSLRLTFSRSAVNRYGASGVPTMSQLGSNVYSPIPNYTGQVSVSGYFSSGAIPGYIYTNVYGISEDLGMTKGSHQINLGGSWLHTQLNALGPFQMNPRMTFNGQLTGNALADFMTGSLDSMLQGNGQVGRDGQNLPSVYAQDNWKINPRLQMNMGLRWDPFIPQHSGYNLASQFNPADFYAGKVSTVYINAPPGLTFPGDPGFPGQSDTTAHYMDFAPRVGFVYDPRGKGMETIRAGYGIFYDSSYLWNTMHVPLNPPWGNTITLNAPSGGLSNPWAGYPGGNPFPTPTRLPSTVQFPIGGTYVFQPLHAHPTYVQQWDLSLQKQISGDWMVSVTYLGNKTTHQWLGHEIDPAVYIPGGPCTLLGVRYNPCSSVASTNARRVLALANPATGQYFGSIGYVDDSGNASYNGLSLVLQHRFNHNFSTLANYTWSHCLDQGEASQDIGNSYQNPYNRRAEWGNCTFDRRQLLNVSVVAQSPTYSNAWLRRIVGQWQGSVIFTASSGAWLNVIDGTDISLTGVGSDRPNVVAGPEVASPTISKWFNTAAFVSQPTGTYGNTGRNTILGPGNWDLDAALWRQFSITERFKLDLRGEGFNVLNHTRLGNPGTSLASGTTFGRITTALDPRIMQVALKLTF